MGVTRTKRGFVTLLAAQDSIPAKLIEKPLEAKKRHIYDLKSSRYMVHIAAYSVDMRNLHFPLALNYV